MASPFKSISVGLDDYKEFEKIKQAWSKVHDAPISMPVLIRIAMVDYAKKLKED